MGLEPGSSSGTLCEWVPEKITSRIQMFKVTGELHSYGYCPLPLTRQVKIQAAIRHTTISDTDVEFPLQNQMIMMKN